MITCPNCGKQNQDHYKFCLGCGSELPRDQVKAPVHASNPTPPSGMPAMGSPAGMPPVMAPAPAPPMPQPMAPQPQPMAPQPQPMAPQPQPMAPQPQPMAPQPQTAAPQPQAAAGSTKCPSCGNDVPAGFKFCGRCGQPMQQAAAAAPAAAPAAAAAPATGKVLGRVIMIQPDGTEGVSLPIGETGLVVGRTAQPPFSEDFFLSPQHAKFSFEGPGKLVVEDTGSLNGVFRRLVPEQIYDIAPGDIIRIGQEVVRFELLPEPKKGLMGSPRKMAWGRLSLVVSKDRIGNSFLVEGEEVLVGRERGHIIFPEDGYVSGLHLKITRNGGKYQVVDVGSSNGSYLRVNGKGQLASGDYMLMGQFLYRVDF